MSYTMMQVSNPFPNTLPLASSTRGTRDWASLAILAVWACGFAGVVLMRFRGRSEEHTSELQSQSNLVCRLLLEKKKTPRTTTLTPPNLPPVHCPSRLTSLTTSNVFADNHPNHHSRSNV